MPRLPTAEQLGQRPSPRVSGGVAPLHLSTPRRGQEAQALIQFGEAVKDVGDSLSRLALKEKLEMDEARGEESFTEYHTNLLELEHGEGGFTRMLGGDAVKQPLTEIYRKKRDDIAKGIRDKLANDDQRAMFDKRAKVADMQFDARIYGHVANQSRAYQNITHEGALETERTAAGLNWDQPGQIEMSILRTNKAIERKARIDGLDPNRPEDLHVINSLKRIAETQIHANVVDQMILTGKDKAASAYYEQIKDRLTPEAIVTLGSKVEVASTDGEAVRGADLAWEALGPQGPNDTVRLDLMDKFLRDYFKDNPKAMREAIADVRSRAVANNDAQQEISASYQAKILDAYEKGADLKALQAMPEYSEMDGTSRSKLRDYILENGWTEQQRARAQRAYEKGEKAELAYGRFWELSNPATLSGLSDLQIWALEPELGKELTNELRTRREKLNSPDSIRAATIDEELFNTEAANAGLDPYKKLSPKEKEQLGRLKNEVENAIDKDQEMKKRSLSRTEKRELIREILDPQVIEKGLFSDTSLPAAVVRPEQRDDLIVPIEKVDPNWAKEAINYMRSTGAIPMDWSDEKAKQAVRGRLERAYARRITHGTSDEIKRELEGPGRRGPLE